MNFPEIKRLEDSWALRGSKLSLEIKEWLDGFDRFFCDCGWSEALPKPSAVPTCRTCGKVMKKKEENYEDL